ncbi:MAG TPA: ATP-dependent DNA helicase RecG, partial [Candidatus Omnitrophota bacterium]|nr:ATP-dependent DNA helicase RecG [Candidatus Omnitrophota bacterium]
MRPDVLFPLFAPVTTLPGVGPKLAPLYERLAGPKVLDMVWHLPSGVVDRRYCPKVREALPGKVATLVVQIDAHMPSGSPKRPYRVRCSDETGFLHLVFFHAHEDWLKRSLPVGEVRVVSGVVEHFNNEIQITHPDHVVPLADQDQVMTIEPVYPLTGGLTAKPVARTVRAALDRT